MDPIPTLSQRGPDEDDTGNSSSAAAHRRIQLQSPQDLLYLKHNAARSAQAKLNLHLPLYATASSSSSTHAAAAGAAQSTTTNSTALPPPPASSSTATAASQPQPSTNRSSNETDSMRKAVEEQIRRYIEQTFALATPSISVAGLDAETLDWAAAAGPDEFEPYDTALAERIAELHARIEVLNGELAHMRRSTVKQAVADWRSAYLAQTAALDRLAEQQQQQQQDPPHDAAVSSSSSSLPPLLPLKAGEKEGDGDGDFLGGRSEQVRRTWNNALEELIALKDTLGETRKTAEEAVAVSSYLSKNDQRPSPAPAPASSSTSTTANVSTSTAPFSNTASTPAAAAAAAAAALDAMSA